MNMRVVDHFVRQEISYVKPFHGISVKPYSFPCAAKVAQNRAVPCKHFKVYCGVNFLLPANIHKLESISYQCKDILNFNCKDIFFWYCIQYFHACVNVLE